MWTNAYVPCRQFDGAGFALHQGLSYSRSLVIFDLLGRFKVACEFFYSDDRNIISGERDQYEFKL